MVTACAVTILWGTTLPAYAAPALDAARLDQVPVIDGTVTDDDAWAGLMPASNFRQVQPNDGAPASQHTEVYVGFTEDALYIGLVAYGDPESIIVSDSRRDSNLNDTDAFLVIIDGVLDRQNGFVFGTNAAGIEYDGQVTREGTGSAFNLNWDGTWKVRSTIFAEGWSAEFEIPFRTLRYGRDSVQDWGINFQRNIRHNNEVAYWAPLERNRTLYRVSDAGTLRGIEPPVQRNLKFTPYALGKWRKYGSSGGTENDSDAGFDIKYSVTPSLTLDLTWNTDFAQVEADNVQINLTRFSLFYPEKREFFLERSELFQYGNSRSTEVFFSRRIGLTNDIIGGGRLTGQAGPFSIGFLNLQTEDNDTDGIPGANNTVLRLRADVGPRATLGGIFCSSRREHQVRCSLERHTIFRTKFYLMLNYPRHWALFITW